MQSQRKSTQRDRLIDGMIDAAAEHGYAAANIAQTITHAGVSRPTFYEYFGDKDDCFHAVLVEINERLLSAIRDAVGRAGGEHALEACIRALLMFADTHPAGARVLINESMTAGPGALDIRDHGLGLIAQVVAEAETNLSGAVATPDISPRTLIGGVYRMLAARLRRSGCERTTLLADLLDWVQSYARPRAAQNWRELDPVPLPATNVPNPPPLRFPAELPRVAGRRRNAARDDRLRILNAVASIAEKHGYHAATIAQICRTAGVDPRVFYRHFTSKQHAFAAANELYYQQLMAVSASAFVSGGSWPERVWNSARISAQYLQENRNLAHVAFVEAHGGGAETIRRVEDGLMAFTLFLQEGYEDARGRQVAAPSRTALEAIAFVCHELSYHELRSAAKPELTGYVTHVAWLSLAPFLGADDANDFIAERVATACGGQDESASRDDARQQTR